MTIYPKKNAIASICTIISILIFSISVADAEVIFVSGEVSGVWSADSVIVTDSIEVPPGQTLTIMPGVEVLFTSYYKFRIRANAVLHAIGSESDTIKFLPFTEGDKSLGLDFLAASSQSIMSYCYISDALTSAVHCANTDLTISKCLFENNEAPTGSQGGGAIELIGGSNAVIENNTIRNNYSTGQGGGIFCLQSSPIIMGNTITGNIAGYYGSASGGGIACTNGSNPQIIGNQISGNEVHPTGSFSIAYGYGGGIYIMTSTSAALSSNIIADNLVDWEPQTKTYGGAVYLYNADVTMSNNVIVNNSAQSNDGGAIYCYGSFPELINNTIAVNMAGGLGGGIYAEFSNFEIVNSILYSNYDSMNTQLSGTNTVYNVTYSDVQGFWPGIGNIDVSPMFRDPFSWDYHLQDSLFCGDDLYSPCIDAGSPDYTDSLLDCSFARGTDASDMGAYGGGLYTPTGIDDDFGLTPSEFGISQNYPNPFNAITTITYNLDEPSDIKLEVFDAIGRKIEILFDGRQDIGEHNVSWNATSFATGMYFYRLQVNDYIESKKMTLLK
jgi:hypothetical protein